MRPFEPLVAIALPVAQPNFDTDQILPARYLQKPRSEGFGEFLFRDLRCRKDGSEDPGFALNQPPYRGARIVVAGRNFACGSSREHAAWALVDHGFRAVIAPSFGDIFHSNALKNGLLPVTLPGDVVRAMLDRLVALPGSRIRVDLEAQIVTGPDGGAHAFAIDPFAKHCLLRGLDELDYTLAQLGHIEAYERRLPAGSR